MNLPNKHALLFFDQETKAQYIDNRLLKPLQS